MKKAVRIVMIIITATVFTAPASAQRQSDSREQDIKSLTPKLIFQDLRSDHPDTFKGVRDISIGPKESIYAFDYDIYEIRKYNPKGLLQLTFGGSGEEPGKFHHLTGIRAVADRLLAVDSIGLSVFTENGELLSQNTFKKEVLIDLPAVHKDGRFAGQQIVAEELKTVLTFRSPDGEELGRPDAYALAEFFPDIQKGEDFYLNNTYARFYCYTFDPKGDLLWAASDSFKIYRYQGNRSQSLIEDRASRAPLPEALVKSLTEQKSRIKPPLFLYVPDSYQLIHHLQCAANGDIWIYLKSRERTGFIRYSESGKELGFYPVDTDLEMTEVLVRIFDFKMYFVLSQRDKVEIYATDLPRD